MRIEVSKIPDSLWDERLLGSKTGTIYQSTAQYEYQKINSNMKHEFLKFLDFSGKVCAQVMLSITQRKGRIGKLSQIPFIQNNFYRWSYGPVIFDELKSDEIINDFQKYLISKKFKVNGIFHPLTKFNKKIILKQFHLKEWSTFLIDLSQDHNTLWENMNKSSARKNINRSKKKEITVKECKYENLGDYYKLVKNVSDKSNSDLKFEYVETTWTTLKKLGYTVFIAYQHEIPISGLGISFFNSYLNEWGVGRSILDYDEKLYSQDLLKWEIICWGKKNNFSYFDLTGANPTPDNDKEIGILQYKKKWGGKQIPLFILEM